MPHTVTLPDGPLTLDDGVLSPYRAALSALPAAPPVRQVYAAAHIVLKEEYRALDHDLERPGASEEIASTVDWPATMAVRRFLDSRGFGIAEAMDTAQRFSIGWPSARRLIQESGRLQLANGFIAGAGVDHLQAVRSADELVEGVVHQGRVIREAGGVVILLPLPWLSGRSARSDEYVAVYTGIINALEGPLLVHWLGPMFQPALDGYFPGDSFDRILAHDPEKVRGCKLSLLDDALEVRVRRALLPRDQVVFTGDDLHFAHLLAGGDPASPGSSAPAVERWSSFDGCPMALGDFSHGLLGILDGIAEPAALALQFLARGDTGSYRELMGPCEELGRLVFTEPTMHYKAGLAFLAWLNGLQQNFMLVNREDRARSWDHLLAVARMAARCGALVDAACAAQRLERFLAEGHR